MRLWSLHPKNLDRQGLLALWREGLLAKKVLKGGTKGYANHPQLQRFRSHADSGAAINHFLHVVADEAQRRGYHFDRSKLQAVDGVELISVTSGQVEYEFEHLRKKLSARDPARVDTLTNDVHPLFRVIDGPVERWEIVK